MAVVVLVALFGAAGAAAAATVPGVAWPTQSVGDRGTDVRAIQHLLRARLIDAAAATDPPTEPVLAPVTGRFGSTTRDNIRAFQASRGLAVTGIVEATTWGKLKRALEEGAEGEAVIALQLELVAKRHAAIAVDGVYGATTTTAVLAFQKHMGLSPTGLVDTRTWQALVWHFELPQFTSKSLCDYSVGNGAANWGTAEAIDTLEAVGRSMVALGVGRIAVGDVSLEHGGNIPGHETHERGLDVDIRPLRKANDQCTWGTRWSFSTYDRTATRAMIRAFRSLAPGHIKVIYFNDPVLIKEGLTRWFAGHDDHVHVRFCEKTHPLATYDC